MMARKTLFSVISLLLILLMTACSQSQDDRISSKGNRTNPSTQPITSQQNTEETEEEQVEEQRVIARYRAVQQAMIDKDIDALDEIILDGTIFRHMSGKTQTKDEYFADIRNGRLDYQSYTMTDEKVEINGNDATLTCYVVLTANAYGAQGSWPFNVTAHLVKIEGEWYMTN